MNVLEWVLQMFYDYNVSIMTTFIELKHPIPAGIGIGIGIRIIQHINETMKVTKE